MENQDNYTLSGDKLLEMSDDEILKVFDKLKNKPKKHKTLFCSENSLTEQIEAFSKNKVSELDLVLIHQN